MVRPPERASRAGGRRVAGACPSVPSRSVAGPRPAPTHAARRQFPKEHACRASPTAESPLSAGRMYRNQPVMRLDRCACTNGSPSSTPATAAARPHARLRLRAYPVLPTPDYTPPVLPAQVRSQRAPRKSPCWPALLALAARVCSTAGSCSAPTCLHAVAPGAVLRSWLSVPLCVRLQMLS